MFVIILLLEFIMFSLVCCYLFYKLKLVEDDLENIYDEIYYYFGEDYNKKIEERKKVV